MLLLCVVFSALGTAQVRLLFSPEDAGATTANFGKGRGVGIWNVMISCQADAGRRLHGGANGHWYRAARASCSAEPQCQQASQPIGAPVRVGRQQRGAGGHRRGGRDGGFGVESERVVAGCHHVRYSDFPQISQLLTQTEPDFSKLLDNVRIGPISLQPGDGGTYTIFSSYSARRKPFSPRYCPPPATIKSYSGKGWHACFFSQPQPVIKRAFLRMLPKGWDLK
jgi:hypothetical protein